MGGDLAGPGDVAGAAAGAGCGAGPGRGGDRRGVLRRRAEPHSGVGPPPRSRRADRSPCRSRPGLGRDRDRRVRAGVLRSQYAAMAPLFEHDGVQLWMPEAGGRVDYTSEHDEHAMTVLGLSSKREVTRTSIRVRTAMAVHVREQGRYLGGRPPYGYRLGDGGPHPNKAHAAWGRGARRLEPDPETAHFVRWIFAQRLAGHSVARIARALNEAGVPCPSASDPGRNPHRTGAGRRWARSPRSCGIRGSSPSPTTRRPAPCTQAPATPPRPSP
jgi:DNA invertase Pin-like site-specific DNA recombinase